jgi:hypothetical protein
MSLEFHSPYNRDHEFIALEKPGVRPGHISFSITWIAIIFTTLYLTFLSFRARAIQQLAAFISTLADLAKQADHQDLKTEFPPRV